MTQLIGNVDKLFKGQQAQEEVICFFRKHWITALPTFIGLFVFIFVEIIFFINFHFFRNLFIYNTSMSLLLVGVMMLATAHFHKVFMRLFKHFMVVVIFTNSRVIEYKKSLFVHDSQEILDLIKIQDVKKSQEGVIRNFLKYGDLKITLSSSEASKLITFVPNVNFHLRCLGRIRRDAFLQGKLDQFGRDSFREFQPVEESMEKISFEIENTLSRSYD